MRISIRSWLAGAGIAGILLVGLVGAVAAASPVPATTAGPAAHDPCRPERVAARGSATAATLQALGDCEINRRFTTLTDLTTRITDSKVLTTPDRASLGTEISNTTAGLTGLKATIDGETSISALRADIADIATEYRVYLLVGPQVRLVNDADGILASGTHLGTVETNLAARIAKAQGAGKDVGAAQAALTAMTTAANQAVALATPLPGELLPLTPAGYDGGTAGPVLTGARKAIEQARDQLKSARLDARAVVDALR